MNELMAGGIVGGIVAAWGWIRQLFSYASSFILVSATYNDLTMRMAVVRKLKLEAYLLPSQQFRFAAHHRQLDSQLMREHQSGSQLPSTMYTCVPYRTLNELNIMWYRGRLLFVRLTGGTVSITCLRGMKLEQFTNQALDEYESTRSTSYDRFRVYSLTGQQRTRNRELQNGPSEVSPPSQMAVAGEGLDNYVDTEIDHSFRFDKRVLKTDCNPFKHLYIPQSVMAHVEFAKRWFASQEWHALRGIPWRRGWLLTGPAGTGKSSLAKAVAQTLGIPVYQFYLSTMTDQEFIREWANMEKPCMPVFEDFDAVFNGRTPVGECELTFDCVLNQISGISSMDGVFLIVTSNHPETIDPAMGIQVNGVSSRPGRLDTVIEIGPLDAECRRRFAQHVLADWPDSIDQAVEAGEGMTAAQFQELLIQQAFKEMNDGRFLAHG